jgi:mono/diheme cytochrome c family protein
LRLHHSIPLALLTLLAGCHQLPASKPVSQLTPTELSGRRIFQANCASCHHATSEQSLNGPGLQALYKKPYLPSGAPANDDRVRAAILNGHNNMPAFANIFTGSPQADQQLNDLLAYLHTL